MSTSATPAPREDPTSTTTVRKSLNQTLSGRMRDARGDVRRQIEQQQTGPSATTTTAAIGGVAGVTAAGVGGLVFLRSLTAFRQWLSAILTGALLSGSPRQARRGRTYLSGPLRDAYETGLRQARAALRAQGYDIGDRSYEAVITDDRHQRALARLYERAYVDIEDALSNVTSETSRAIADGGYIDADAVNNRELADAVNERLRANYGKRLSPLANSLPVRAANRAALTEYASAGVERVGVEAEAESVQQAAFTTSGDAKVCDECKQVAAKNPYPLSEVPFPTVDTHLQCRCLVLPV